MTFIPLPPGVALRPASIGDAAELSSFAREMFDITFGHSVTPDEMQQFLDATYSVARQAEEISSPQMRTMLAVDADGVAGFYQLRRDARPPVEQASEAQVEIARFYVARRWHGRGLAAPLMRSALSASKACGGTEVWLGVWEDNARAIAFYRRFGFEAVGEQAFQLGSVTQRDLVMSRALREPD